MKNHQDDRSDDIVSRAVIALKQAPLVEGPSEATLSRTSAAMREAAQRPVKSRWRNHRVARWASKAAAGLLALAASGLVLWAVLTSPVGTSLALAQVVEKIAAAKTLAFDMIVDVPQGQFPVIKARLAFAEPGRMRGDIQDPTGEGIVTSVIMDMPAGKSIILSPKLKTAMTSVMKGTDPSMWKDSMIDQLRSLATRSTVDLGEKEIDGIRVKGFEVQRETTSMRVWANSQTGDPVRVEISEFFFPPPIGKGKIVWTKFQLSDEVDSALFSVEPPEGYLVIKSPVEIDLTSVPTEHVVTVLREYSKRMDGEFPPRISDLGESIYQELEKRHGPFNDQQATQQAGVFNAPLAQLNAYIMGHKSGKDYQYYPGHKLGEKDKLVFWFRDEKTGKYTAVFGDLRVENVTKEQLPAGDDAADAK